MALTVNYYSGSVPDTSRAHSSFWNDCPDAASIARVGAARFWDDFTDGGFVIPTTEGFFGRYKGFTSPNGLICDPMYVTTPITTLGMGGVNVLQPVTSDNDSVAIQPKSYPFKIARGQGKLWFEARILLSTIAATKMEVFCGLGEKMALAAAVPITTTAATLANQNIVGFYRTETPSTGAIQFSYRADGVTQVDTSTTEAVAVAATWTKVGFTYDPITYVLQPYQDGTKLATTKTIPSAAGTDFPNDVFLAPTMAVRLAAGPSTWYAAIDWWDVVQMPPV